MTLLTPGDLAHLHLLLNHAPTVGAAVAVALLVLAWVRKSDDVLAAGLELTFGIALATLPVFLTGLAAQATLRGVDGVSTSAIVAHEDAALFAFALMEMTGAVAWLAVWQRRRLGRPTRSMVGVVFVLSCVTLSAMTRTALLGGTIRHPEIVSASSAAASSPSGGWLTVASVGTYVLDHEWVWPTSETLHFLGMSLMFGSLLVVSIRLFGGMRSMSFAAAHRLLPLGVLGFGINLVTGILFFVAAPEQYVNNVSFHWKMIFLELSGASLLILTVSDWTWTLDADVEPPRLGKALAALVLVSAVGVMYFGRMLPFIGEAF